MIATTLGLGWALFSDHMSQVMQLDEQGRRSVDQRVAELVAAQRGAHVVRVHDVAATVDALRVWQAASA